MNAPDHDDARTLEILDIVQRNEQVSQRHLARQLGVALGLANSYLKRCVKKGWVKVQQAPANRYLYTSPPLDLLKKAVSLRSTSAPPWGFIAKRAIPVSEYLTSAREMVGIGC